MEQSQKQMVVFTNNFEPMAFPLVAEELRLLNEQTADICSTLKSSILISFLKNHSINCEWITANPSFALLISTGRLKAEATESLFESSKMNKVFQHDLEGYIRQILQP